ncbi:hypothetical protein RBWH47_00911 [Rhodopirellula baltica WH47]|uniref:Uncharacterized protein n=1 Tax=Rhodopirellula baltica WH47 TaxID=991778 RepID=F2AQF8_RHOBT|nr:hypothetical protein RBWH47_00911 [Rhodopirellula baltica WH47]
MQLKRIRLPERSLKFWWQTLRRAAGKKSDKKECDESHDQF